MNYDHAVYKPYEHVGCKLLDNQATGYVRGHHVSVFEIDTCHKMTIASRLCLLYL